LSFLSSVVVHCIFSRLLCYGRLIKDEKLPFFLLRSEVVFIGTVVSLIPLTHFIYLVVHEGLLVCGLSQMGKRGGVYNTMISGSRSSSSLSSSITRLFWRGF
jgi:hypothetical protein